VACQQYCLQSISQASNVENSSQTSVVLIVSLGLQGSPVCKNIQIRHDQFLSSVYPLPIPTWQTCICDEGEGLSKEAIRCGCYKLVHCTTQQKSEFRGGFRQQLQPCTVPTYYCASEYLYNQCPEVWNLIQN